MLHVVSALLEKAKNLRTGITKSNSNKEEELGSDNDIEHAYKKIKDSKPVISTRKITEIQNKSNNDSVSTSNNTLAPSKNNAPLPFFKKIQQLEKIISALPEEDEINPKISPHHRLNNTKKRPFHNNSQSSQKLSIREKQQIKTREKKRIEASLGLESSSFSP